MRKGVVGRMTGLLALVAMVAIGALLLSPSIDIGSDSDGGLVADLTGIADVDVGLGPETASAGPFDCIAARVFRSFTFPFLFGYWNFIIGRVCTTWHYSDTMDSPAPAEVARSGTYRYEAIKI